jgi:hypothetical protein
MRRVVSIVISGLVVLSMCVVFASCGNVGNPIHDNLCSLDGVSVSVDDKPMFVIDDDVKSSMSEEQLEEKNASISSLNKAIQDRSELAGMLSADMIDGASNDYLYEGGESFFRVVGEFADENYSKAREMFPGITCDEFYHHTAVAYAVCNHDPELFETPYIDSMGTRDQWIKYFIPAFDQLMSSAFWTSYCSDRYEIDYDNDIPYEQRFSCEDLDSSITFELTMMLQMGVKKSVMEADLEKDNKISVSRKKYLAKYITNLIRDIMLDEGVKRISYDDDDYFFQIGNIISFSLMSFNSFSQDKVITTLGHMGYASVSYLGRLVQFDGDLASFAFASLLCAGIGGEDNPLVLANIQNSKWDVNDWASIR